MGYLVPKRLFKIQEDYEEIVHRSNPAAADVAISGDIPDGGWSWRVGSAKVFAGAGRIA